MSGAPKESDAPAIDEAPDTGAQRLADVVHERGGLRLVSRLGHGGMADLFLGVQMGEQGFARLVVVKKIRAEREGGTENLHLLGMFFDEAKTVAALSHPHIVKVYDLTRTDDGDIAIVMEYVDGETLSYVWRQLGKNQMPMPVPIVLKLMLDAAEALGAAHSATSPDGKPLQLIHRDVSPQNLMLDKNGYLKVIDFGIAKSTQQTEMTSPGGIKGKLSYLAPETFRVRDIDPRVDIYGLGLVLWELLTLKPGIDLAKDAPLQEVVDHIEQLKLAPASSLRADVPTELDDVVKQATAADRAQRFASMDDFAAALRKVSVQTGVSSAAGVKKWFNATFSHRLEKRRAFEADAFARADKPPPPAGAAALPVVRVETTVHAQRTSELNPKHPLPPLAPLSEAARAPTSQNAPSSSWSLPLLFAAIALSLAVVAWTLLRDTPSKQFTDTRSAVGELSTGSSPDGDDMGATAGAPTLVDAGAPLLIDAGTPPSTSSSDPIELDFLKDPTLPDPVGPKKVRKAIATTNPPPTSASPAPAAIVPLALPATPPLPPPVTAPAAIEAPPPRPLPTTKAVFYSGNGNWTGTQVLQNGCKKCHAVDVKAKTRRQWERFFERDVHDRHARLDDVFSSGEQERALQSILLLVDDKAHSSGVAGVR